MEGGGAQGGVQGGQQGGVSCRKMNQRRMPLFSAVGQENHTRGNQEQEVKKFALARSEAATLLEEARAERDQALEHAH